MPFKTLCCETFLTLRVWVLSQAMTITIWASFLLETEQYVNNVMLENCLELEKANVLTLLMTSYKWSCKKSFNYWTNASPNVRSMELIIMQIWVRWVSWYYRKIGPYEKFNSRNYFSIQWWKIAFLMRLFIFLVLNRF